MRHRVFFAFVVLLGVLPLAATPVAAEESPNVLVLVEGGDQTPIGLGDQAVSGQGWEIDDLVHLYIDEEYVAAAIAEPNSEGSATPLFNTVALGLTIEPGDLVRLARPSDGFSVETIVADLTVTAIDVAADTVTGAAQPGSDVIVSDFYGAVLAGKAVTSNGEGVWLADFAADWDIVPGTIGLAVQLQGGGATVVVWSPTSHVSIDIRPGSERNVINLASKGVVPVVVLGGAAFDVTDIDPPTALLEGVSPVRWAFGDVDDDGLLDLRFFYKTQEVAGAIEPDATTLTLVGDLLDGSTFIGSDTVSLKS